MSIIYILLLLLMIPPVVLIQNRNLSGLGYIDFGVLFLTIVFLYAWFPLLGFVLFRAGFGGIYDYRLDGVPLRLDEVANVGLTYLIFMTSFAISYCLLRREVSPVELVRGDGFQVKIVLMMVVFIFLADFAVQYFFGVGVPKSYGESYSQLLQFSRTQQQILSALSQIKFVVTLLAMVFIISWRPQFYRYVGLFVFMYMVFSTLSGYSRAHAFLLMAAYVLCFTMYVRHLKPHFFFLIGVGGILLFCFAGMLRTGAGYGDFLLYPFQAGELISIFLNPIDLTRKLALGGANVDLFALYSVDILRFVPQQFLEYQKFDPALWYVKEFYPQYYDIGGGFVFGIISESVMGFGLVDALLRGLALGLGFAFVFNRCNSAPLTPIKFFIYVWFVISSYHSVRDTTFSLFARFFYEVFPLVVLLLLVNYVTRSITKNYCDKSISREFEA